MKKIILGILSLSLIAFGEIRDEVNILTKLEKENIEKIIEKIEKEKKIKIFLNIFDGEESFQIQNPQRSIILNIQKISLDIIATELSFTGDLKLDDKKLESDLILENAKEIIFKEEYSKYIIEVIEEISDLVTIEEKIKNQNFISKIFKQIKSMVFKENLEIEDK